MTPLKKWMFPIVGCFSLLYLLGAAPLWAWRGGGWRGPRLGVYVGPGPWWGYDPWYDPYYDDPYYGYGYPYAYSPAYPSYDPASAPAASPSDQASPDPSRHDLRFLNQQIARARDEVDYEFQDGDISRTERDAEIHRLSQIAKRAHAEARANGGALSADQEDVLLRQLRGQSPMESSPEEYVPAARSNQGLDRVNGEIRRLRALLDKKQADGDITKAQQQGMSDYLSRIEKQVQSDASANDGALTPDQESAALQQLQRAGDSISQNFIVK